MLGALFSASGALMKFVLHPWQLLLLALAASLNRQQQQTIEYLITENQILKEKLGKKRILLNDNQRRRLAVKGKILGRKLLLQIAHIACPDTILRWHNLLVAEKWDYSNRRKKVGRPRLGKALVDLVVRMAKENPTWGYERIEGALKNLRYRISSSSIGNILKAHGIEPAPERKRQTSWSTFLKTHWDCLASIDFTTIEVWTRDGLVTYYPALRHGSCHSSGPTGGLHCESNSSLDDSDRPEPDRSVRRLPSQFLLSGDGSRHQALPRSFETCWSKPASSLFACHLGHRI